MKYPVGKVHNGQSKIPSNAKRSATNLFEIEVTHICCAVFIVAVALTVLLSNRLQAQVFAPVPAMSFTKAFGAANPLPQTLMVANVGAAFNYTFSFSTTSGGSWLTVTAGQGCSTCATTTPIKIAATTITLAAGTYLGSVVVTSQFGGVKMTVPVSLTVTPAAGAFFDNLPGQVSFSLLTGGLNPPSQDIEVRNGGTGTLNWTLAKSTSDTGAWLGASPSSGTGSTTVTVSLTKANLPGAGAVAGTFVGQLVFQTATGNVTVPVSIVVGANVFNQVNPISFAKVFAGANPLPQTLTIASTGTSFNYTVSAATATGGSWLTVSTPTGCGTCVMPVPLRHSESIDYPGRRILYRAGGCPCPIRTAADHGAGHFDHCVRRRDVLRHYPRSNELCARDGRHDDYEPNHRYPKRRVRCPGLDRDREHGGRVAMAERILVHWQCALTDYSIRVGSQSSQRRSDRRDFCRPACIP